MIAHAYETVPYYRETMGRLGLSPQDFRTAADLTRLPVIERDELQRDPEYFVSRAQPLQSYLRLRTGGSTGAPREVFHHAASIIEAGAHVERQRSIMRRVARRRLRYREAIIAPPFGTAQATHEFLAEHLLVRSDLVIKRLYLSLLDPPVRNAGLLNAFRPDVVHGYGSYLELLFPIIHSAGEEFHRPRVVVYSSDAMSASSRHLLTETMGLPVLSSYGAVEAFHIGFECERNLGYHLNVDLVPLRVVGQNGHELEQGESGEVILSNLVNAATVLLNYRLGDVASIQPFRCPCGRSLPLLSFIEGRTDDWIESASGEKLHAQAVRTLFTDEDQIWQYQVAQVTSAHFHVTVVSKDGADREAMCARLAEKFARRIGAGTTLDVSFVDAVARTAGGKTRVVVGGRAAVPHARL
jgi:phenylacetate-CoA ligase